MFLLLLHSQQHSLNRSSLCPRYATAFLIYVDSSRRRSSSQCEYVVGNRVLVAGSLAGTVRYVGTTQFASGIIIVAGSVCFSC